MEAPMHVTLVHVHVKPDGVIDFLGATRRNHEAPVTELSVVRRSGTDVGLT
jgi:hypothetical protein